MTPNKKTQRTRYSRAAGFHRWTMQMRHFLFTISLMAINGCGCIEDHYSFPPDGQTCTDPSGRFSIHWQQATDKTSHCLSLISEGSRNATQFYAFNRSADILWSPSGNRFAVTDWGGSDFSEVWVIESRNPTNQVNAEDCLPYKVVQEAKKNHHLYFEAKKWISEDRLIIRAWGHGWKEDGTGSYEQLLEIDLHTMSGRIK